MKPFCFIFLSFFVLVACKKKQEQRPRDFSSVEIEDIYTDSLLSIRAIDILDDGSLAFASNNGAFGLYDQVKKSWMVSKQEYDGIDLHFRAVAHTSTDFFMLSIDNPALLFKTGDSGQMELVYKEESEGVFYDAMGFWNNEEGIAIGDSMNGCLSMIVTRDGGNTWHKILCDDLPKAEEGEGAFAASNTNIKLMGNKVWVATTKGNIYYSEDKGMSWRIVKTPIKSKENTEGIFTIDLYDEKNGFAMGGDYTKPELNGANKAITKDGGRTWILVGKNEDPGYRSCVQYIPNTAGKELVAVGFNGIDFSNDHGYSWKHIGNEGFYTLRFLNDSTAYAAGTGRISKLIFKE